MSVQTEFSKIEFGHLTPESPKISLFLTFPKDIHERQLNTSVQHLENFMFNIPRRGEGVRSPLLPTHFEQYPSQSPAISAVYRYIKPHLGLIVAILYGVVSISITVFNKAVLTHYQFNFSNTLSLGQCLCSLAFLVGLRHYKYITFPNLAFQTAFEVRNPENTNSPACHSY